MMEPSHEIGDWLAKCDLAQYAPAFAEHQIDFETLADLTSEDLREIGVHAVGHRKRLLAAIAALGTPEAEAQANVPASPPVSVEPAPLPAPAIPALPSVPRPSLTQVVTITAPEQAAASPAMREDTPASSQSSKPPVPDRPTAEAPKPAPAAIDNPPSSRLPFWTRVMTRRFLLVSILAHILFGLGATYFIVQRVQGKRKVTFKGGPPAVSASKRALEHKVSLAKKKHTGGAPPQAKRIVSAGIAKISLPDLPSIPTPTTMPGMKASMGGAGFGSGLGFGQGAGSSMGGGGAGGASGMTLFGFRGAGGGLIGTFYDLKQTRDHKPTDMAGPPKEGVILHSPQAARYQQVVGRFVNGWNPSVLERYYRAPGQMSLTQVFIPTINANAAPKAFEVDKECQPRRWLVHYSGEIVAPRSGRFRFVGYGDDILIVRCKGRNVLDGSLTVYKVAPQANESPTVPSGKFALSVGQWIEARQGEGMKIDILIGECPGGEFNNFLFVEQEGVPHPPGSYPVFQLRAGDIPGGDAPAHSGAVLFGSKQTGFGTLLR